MRWKAPIMHNFCLQSFKLFILKKLFFGTFSLLHYSISEQYLSYLVWLICTSWFSFWKCPTTFFTPSLPMDWVFTNSTWEQTRPALLGSGRFGSDGVRLQSRLRQQTPAGLRRRLGPVDQAGHLGLERQKKRQGRVE